MNFNSTQFYKAPNLHKLNNGNENLLAHSSPAKRSFVRTFGSLPTSSKKIKLSDAVNKSVQAMQNKNKTLSELVMNDDCNALQKYLTNEASSQVQLDAALLCAVQNDKLMAVDILLDFDANSNLRDVTGTSLLMLAAEKGYLDIFTQLHKKGASLTVVNDAGLSALDVAILNDHDSIVSYILDHALFMAIVQKRVDWVKRLLDLGVGSEQEYYLQIASQTLREKLAAFKLKTTLPQVIQCLDHHFSCLGLAVTVGADDIVQALPDSIPTHDEALSPAVKNSSPSISPPDDLEGVDESMQVATNRIVAEGPSKYAPQLASQVHFKKSRPSFPSYINSARKAATPKGVSTDSAHRLSYQNIRVSLETKGIDGSIDLIKALTIPARDFGTIKAGDTTYYDAAMVAKDHNDLLKLLNASPFNLRPGDSSTNRSLGSSFDPNKSPGGSHTPISKKLHKFALDVDDESRSSSVLTPTKLAAYEKKSSEAVLNQLPIRSLNKAFAEAT